jgi:hypothetical protein
LAGDSLGPPPLKPFGLKLHHDGRFSHEGQPIAHQRLREHFDRSIEVQEAAFFVRVIDMTTGKLGLSDGSSETLDVSTLSTSPIDGALLCRIKYDMADAGLHARFTHSAQADFMQAIEESDSGYVVSIGGREERCPDF